VSPDTCESRNHGLPLVGHVQLVLPQCGSVHTVAPWSSPWVTFSVTVCTHERWSGEYWRWQPPWRRPWSPRRGQLLISLDRLN